MPSRRLLTKMVAAWLPVACLLGLAFVAAPDGSAQTRITGTLSISPKSYYGGQALTFSGSIGRSGKHKIWLEFNMDRPGDVWTRIDGSSHTTDGSGHFKFQFPARGMNNIKLRVAAKGLATTPVNFTAADQAVSVAVDSSDPLDQGDCLPDFNQFKSYAAPTGTLLHVRVDSTPDGEPVLKNRKVTLQQRTGAGDWTAVPGAATTLDEHGKARFDVTEPAVGDVVYRAVLGSITNGANRIGWFPSFPTYVEAENRPIAAVGAHSQDPNPGISNPADIDLVWIDTTPSSVVAWNKGGTAPDTPASAQDHQVVLGGSPLNIPGLVPDQSYAFSVFTRSAAGICSGPVTATAHTDPTPPVTNVHATEAPADHVSLTWSLPLLPSNTNIDGIRVRRAQGGTPPADQNAGVSVADFDFPTTDVVDFDVNPSTQYSYSVFVRINGVWSVRASTTVATGAP